MVQKRLGTKELNLWQEVVPETHSNKVDTVALCPDIYAELSADLGFQEVSCDS